MTWWADKSNGDNYFHCANSLPGPIYQQSDLNINSRDEPNNSEKVKSSFSKHDKSACVLPTSWTIELIVKLQILKVILLSKFYCKLYCYD